MNDRPEDPCWEACELQTARRLLRRSAPKPQPTVTTRGNVNYSSQGEHILCDETMTTCLHAADLSNADLPPRKDSCSLTNLLNRLDKFQQVGVDFILVRSREAVGPARIVNFLRFLDEPGRFLC
jgi:hypothetical protein